MKYELRPATDADREFCFRLNEACFRERIEQIGGWDEAAERIDCASQFRVDSDSIVMVQGREAGHLAIEDHADRIEVRMLLLAPEVQCRGIGSAILRMVVERARGRGVPATLWVTEWNEGAIRFYRRFGFSVVDEVWRPEKHVRKLRMATRTGS
jgi:ribosomal protein S18 acetylase RimI-like enzyme